MAQVVSLGVLVAFLVFMGRVLWDNEHFLPALGFFTAALFVGIFMFNSAVANICSTLPFRPGFCSSYSSQYDDLSYSRRW
jgi:hypothetical protein